MSKELGLANIATIPSLGEIPVISLISFSFSAGIGYALNPIGVLENRERKHRCLAAIAGACLAYGPTLAVAALKVFTDMNIPLMNEMTLPNLIGASTGVALGALRRRDRR